jgi:hypothetical protein
MELLVTVIQLSNLLNIDLLNFLLKIRIEYKVVIVGKWLRSYNQER